MKIAVLGSSGAMGSFFVRYFLARGYRVVGSDKVCGRGPVSPRFSFVTSNSDAVRDAEVVFIAVPIRQTVRVLREVAGSIRKGSLVVEISSIKAGSLQQTRRILSGRKAALLSLHPLFGPSATSETLKFAVVGKRKDTLLARKLFPKARIVQLGEKEHDRMMAYVLSLVHLTNLALVSAIAKGIGVEGFRKVATPTSKAQLEIAKAVLAQSPSLYSYIQTENPFTIEVLGSLIAELENLRKVVRGGYGKSFEAMFSALAAEFNKGELEGALRAVYSLSAA